MFVALREAVVDVLESSAMSDERQGIRPRSRLPIETAVGAASLAAAFLVPDGYPQIVALSVVSLCSYAWILRACQRE